MKLLHLALIGLGLYVFTKTSPSQSNPNPITPPPSTPIETTIPVSWRPAFPINVLPNNPQQTLDELNLAIANLYTKIMQTGPNTATYMNPLFPEYLRLKLFTREWSQKYSWQL